MKKQMSKWFDPKNDIKQEGDKATVYVYGYIGDDPWDEAAAEPFVKALADIDAKEIDLRIHSPGGSVYAGAAMTNAVKEHPATVTANIDGQAASMATRLAIAADVVKMAENGVFMIHNASGGVWGEAGDMDKYSKVLKDIDVQANREYQAKTGLNADEIKTLMDDTTFMTAEEAIAFKFIDEVTNAVEVDDSTAEQYMHGVKMPKEFKQVQLPVKVIEHFSKPAKAEKPEVNTVSKKETAAPEAVTETTDIQAERDSAIKMERKRVADIQEVFKGHEMEDIQAKAVADGVTSGEAAKMLLKELGKESEPAQSHVEIKSNSLEGIKNAVHVKAGVGKPEQGNKYQHMSILELASQCLEISGQNVAGRSKTEIARMATHSTSDFPNIMADSANKAVLRGWEEREDTSYLQFVDTGTVSDFKIATRAGVQNFSDLELVPEGDEYTYGTMGETGAQVKVAKYGRKFSLTWEAIINDDLGEFSKVAQRMGAAARRNESKLVYSVFPDNPAMLDGDTLFHANHGNIAATPGAPSEAGFEEIITQMETQSRDGVDLVVTPTYYVGPPGYKFSVNRLLQNSARVGASNDEINVLEGVLTPIHTNRLSGAAWYVLAGNGDTIEVTRLAGYENPETFESMSADIDGIEYKVRHVTAATPLDYVGIHTNAGA